MSRYLSILANQRPFPFSVDEHNRVVFSVNFRASAAAPVDEWEEELAQVLIDGGIATAIGTDVFVGEKVTIPNGAGPYIQIGDTGGVEPQETHDGSRYEQLSAQITIRALSYRTARTRALAVWRALDGLRNSTVAAA